MLVSQSQSIPVPNPDACHHPEPSSLPQSPALLRIGGGDGSGARGVRAGGAARKPQRRVRRQGCLLRRRRPLGHRPAAPLRRVAHPAPPTARPHRLPLPPGPRMTSPASRGFFCAR